MGEEVRLCRIGRYIAYKWKNYFVEMKGDVWMSVHEKGGKQIRKHLFSVH